MQVDITIRTGPHNELDLYVTGFPCSPFSQAGKRDGFEAAVANCFKATVATIKTVRPRAWILENVPQLGGKKHKSQLDAALTFMKDEYKIAIVFKNTNMYDLPQDRPRMYILGFRFDAMRSKKSLDIVQDLVAKVEQSIGAQGPHLEWHQWLEKRGMPVCPADASSPGFVRVTTCGTCSFRRCCPHHVCTCDKCTKLGTLAKKCMWRVHTKEWMTKNAARVREYKQGWSKVLKTKLKCSPDYYKLAEAKNLYVPKVIQESPRVRAAITAWSSTTNLFVPSTLVNSSQAVNRTAPKSNGQVPSLTTTCGRLFAPSAGVFLKPAQCLALQGFDCSKLPLDDFTAAELETFAGMAMGLPVVGTLMVAMVSQLKPA